jgi:hypothetical protein
MKSQMRTIQIPAEMFDALGLRKNDTLEVFSPDDGVLVLRVLHDGGNYICDGDCGNCPFDDTECDGKCDGCPCSDYCDEREADKE